MRIPTRRQQTGAQFSFKGSASSFRLQNDWQKTNFRLCRCGELLSTRHRDGKCQRHKPSRGEKIWFACRRGIKQVEEDPNNPGAGGGFTCSTSLLSPLRWGVAEPVFGWHVSIISVFQTHLLCAGGLLHMCDLCARFMSHNKLGLWQLGVTHVLNAAHGKLCCKGNADFYGTTVKYFGVPANDLPTFDLSPFFYPAAEFIHRALSSDGKPSRLLWDFALKQNICVFTFGLLWLSGKVFVHCAVGVSRSAALVLAYLMIHHRHSLLSSVHCVQQKRWIFPNRGFLKQLIRLDQKLQELKE